MNLKTRLNELERRQEANKQRSPGLVYISRYQSFEEAMTAYKQKHGYDLPGDAPIIRIEEYDASVDHS